MNADQLQSRIRQTLASGTLSHAYLLEGAEQDELFQLAQGFAQAALCPHFSAAAPGFGACGLCASCRKVAHGNHENIHVVLGDENSVKDEMVAQMQEHLRRKPYEDGRNVALLCRGDTVTQRAQNRLLKTLEEPPGDALLILLCENLENLLPTVRSRCVIFHVEQESEAAAETEALCAVLGELLLKRAPYYQKAALLADLGKDREAALRFVDGMERWMRDLVFEKKTAAQEEAIACVRLLEEARADLLRPSYAVNYILKALLLQLSL